MPESTKLASFHQANWFSYWFALQETTLLDIPVSSSFLPNRFFLSHIVQFAGYSHRQHGLLRKLKFVGNGTGEFRNTCVMLINKQLSCFSLLLRGRTKVNQATFLCRIHFFNFNL